MKGKTYKREVAFLMLLYIFYTGIWGSTAVLNIVLWPFMVFIAAAWGMDWASKQTDFIRK